MIICSSDMLRSDWWRATISNLVQSEHLIWRESEWKFCRFLKKLRFFNKSKENEIREKVHLTLGY